MSYQKIKRKENTSIPGALLMGEVVAWITTLLLATIITGMIAGNKLSISALPTTVGVTIALSGFLSAMVSGAKVGQSRALVCICAGAIYYATLLCCNAIFYDGRYKGILGAAMTIMGSALVAALLKKKQKKGKQRRY